MFCSECGMKNDDDGNFCQGCGAAISGTRSQVAVSKGSKKKVVSIIAVLLSFTIIAAASYFFLSGLIGTSGLFSKDLSRSKAKKLLSGEHDVITTTISTQLSRKYQYVSGDLQGWFKKTSYPNVGQINLLEKLQSAGYITIGNSSSNNGRALGCSGSQQWDYYIVTPTDKLKPFIHSDYSNVRGISPMLKIVIADIVVDNITGITKMPMDESARSVQYKTRIVPNKLSEIFPLEEEAKNPPHGEALFRKYDNGWRLEHASNSSMAYTLSFPPDVGPERVTIPKPTCW